MRLQTAMLRGGLRESPCRILRRNGIGVSNVEKSQKGSIKDGRGGAEYRWVLVQRMVQ